MLLLFPFQTQAQRRTQPIPKQLHSFDLQGENFLLDGKPFVIRSGEMHYPRVPREYWRDRMKKAKAMGLNTITTYIFWNLHEPKPGVFNFTGNLDVAAYIRTAQEEGLWVIVRPGPYICTEWDFGGLPSWLLADEKMKVRSNDEKFLKAAKRYMMRVGLELKNLQITKGGPVIMAQVENEYGSFGNDYAYKNAVKQMMIDAGFEVTLFTSDGPLERMLKGGTLPDVLSVINFGVGDGVEKQFENFAKFRQGVPKMVGEYWIGWFDHWGEPHHIVPAEVAAKGVEFMLSKGISFNLYMFHGGTSFGFMAGANYNKDMPIQPDTTSYDYDSPLDEAGRPTAKFFALRNVIKKYLAEGETLPQVSTELQMVEIPKFELKESASLFSLLGKPVRSEHPMTMEALGQSYGFVFYRHLGGLEENKNLELEVRDYALVMQDGKIIDTLDRRLNQMSFIVTSSQKTPLDILVENMGRINYGAKFVEDRKGIVGKVTLDGQEMKGWLNYSLPLNNLSMLKFSNKRLSPPAFYRGTFELKQIGDTFLDMRGWGKGHVWVNGHHVGRYWKIGPQQSLYVPASWFKKGLNQIIVLDLEDNENRMIESFLVPIFQTKNSE
jgi:beta-galactosidase